MTNVVAIKGTRQAPKASRSKMDTIIFTAAEINKWILPPFQRPLRINEKVRLLAENLKANGGVITGVLTLGHVAGKKDITWLVDGQHRIEAFKISELEECIADVRICDFDSMSEMADEFVNLNSQLNKMRPDDILRGLEPSSKALRTIRSECPYVGYDQIRRGSTGSPIVSMSALLRCWVGSRGDTPTANTSGQSAKQIAEEIDETEVLLLVKFLHIARAAWGSDPENYRLWGGLNLALCAWMYRRLVVDQERGTKRYVKLNSDLFKKCLMSVSANADYLDWLPGRTLSDRDRGPCYGRLKAIFAARLKQELKTDKPLLPQTAWASR
jgi:hypothetical protein